MLLLLLLCVCVCLWLGPPKKVMRRMWVCPGCSAVCCVQCRAVLCCAALMHAGQCVTAAVSVSTYEQRTQPPMCV